MKATIESPGMRLGFRATIFHDDGSELESAFFPAFGAGWNEINASADAAYAAAKAWVALWGLN